ncbi:MAG TPA: histidine--tRNA ligase [Thermoanaerobaculia bacterium]|nr:histidine--tRNA ligase [Thermoanaerobaculia bacterium]
MTPRFRAVKGTRDLFPPESDRWIEAERIARETFGSWGYGEVRTPVLEDTALFARSVGETTDIVHKEMYTFPDRKGRSLTMRPENTAGVVRALIENGLASGPTPLRLYYVGPQFRYERPQAGRYREFSQIGVELFGVEGPSGEAEVIEMLFAFLESLGFRDLSVSLNSVGTAETRASFGEALRAHVLPRAKAFGDDDRRKLADNPLRLFDSKDPAVRETLAEAPRTLDFLDDRSRLHHGEVQRLLTEAGIPHHDDPSLVRGLDYYTRTVFEVSSGDLGAQDAILGGGRYDGLVASLGGPSLPAVGFAIGEDRLLQVAPLTLPRRAFVIVLPQGTDDVADATRIAREVRVALPGGRVEVDLTARGLKKGMARASSLYAEADTRGFDGRAMLALFVGERERAAGAVTVKKLATGDQETIPVAELVRRLAAERSTR